MKPTIEHSRFCNLNFTGEALDKVLVNDAVRGCEKSENVGDKVALVVVELVLPVMEVLGEIYLLGSPERGLRLLVHLPDLLLFSNLS